MSADLRRRPAPQRRGRWLFLGILVTFWSLLAATGMNRFKRPDPKGLAYTIAPADLAGLTGLRLEGVEDAQDRGRGVEVVIDAASVVRITLKARGGDGDGDDLDLSGGGQPWMTARREGDTLVLRWADVPKDRQPARGAKRIPWVDRIVLPVQFQHLALPNGRIDVRVPMEQLAVAGQEITVQGAVRQLDLWSTQCRPCRAGALPQPAEDGAVQCEQRQARYPDKLAVAAGQMRSLRVNARAGKLALSDTENLAAVDLQLGGSVALSLDRADLLPRLRVGGDTPGMPAPAACPSGPAVPSRPVPLMPTAS